MTPETLMAMYPHLFAVQSQTAPPPPPAVPAQGAELPPVDISQAPVYPNTGPPVPEAQMPPEYQTLPTYTGPDQTPEPNAVTAPSPADPGPATPVTASNAPAKRKGLGGFISDLGGAIGGLIAPEPGSFMDSAYQNTIYGAKRGMRDYARTEATANLAAEEAALKLKNLRTSGEFKIVGNNIFHLKPDGSTEFIAAPVNSDTRYLLHEWDTTTDPRRKQVIEQALKGYQYGDRYLDAKGKWDVKKAKVSGGGSKVSGSNVLVPSDITLLPDQ
jgi:hypothetical protein